MFDHANEKANESQNHRLANAAKAIALAITPCNATGGKDASGGNVESLTEAVMGVTAGLHRIADAIESLAEAVRERQT